MGFILRRFWGLCEEHHDQAIQWYMLKLDLLLRSTKANEEISRLHQLCRFAMTGSETQGGNSGLTLTTQEEKFGTKQNLVSHKPIAR